LASQAHAKARSKSLVKSHPAFPGEQPVFPDERAVIEIPAIVPSHHI